MIYKSYSCLYLLVSRSENWMLQNMSASVSVSHLAKTSYRSRFPLTIDKRRGRPLNIYVFALNQLTYVL